MIKDTIIIFGQMCRLEEFTNKVPDYSTRDIGIFVDRDGFFTRNVNV